MMATSPAKTPKRVRRAAPTRPKPSGIRIGPDAIPDCTLGWEILGWTREYLQQPDGPTAGEPWVFTDEQARFILNWYAVDAEGRFVHRYGMLRRMKGWGKDPVGAVLCCVEFVGPCRFAGWASAGQTPLAQPHYAAWVQVAAVSRDQTRNTMTLFPGLLSRQAIEEYGIDLGKEIIYAERGRKRIEAVTSSPRALEGGRATFILKNETHHWLAPNEGHEMAKVIARNAAKSRDGSSRVLAISNAHAPGEDSDAEHDYEAWTKIAQGVSAATGILYDSLEAPETDLAVDAAVLAAIEACRGDSYWVSPDRLLAEIRDPRTTPAMARRFYLNQIVAEEDKPFDRHRFEALVRPGYHVAAGELITLGFDGSLTRDHTALIGTEVATGYQWVAGYWEPERLPNGDPQIDFAAVDQMVQAAFERWNVWRMYADPYKWGTYLAKWAGQFGETRVVSWSTTLYRKMAVSLQQYRAAIDAGDLSHDGDPRFVAAIANAHKHMLNIRDDDNELLYIIQKERQDSPLKIDAAVAGDLSWQAAQDAIASGALESQEAGAMFV